MRAKTKVVIRHVIEVILASLIPLLLILYSIQIKKYTDLSNEVTELERKQERLVEENKRLVSDISLLSSSTRIEKIAVEELGMHKAETDDIVRVEMKGNKSE